MRATVQWSSKGGGGFWLVWCSTFVGEAFESRLPSSSPRGGHYYHHPLACPHTLTLASGKRDGWVSRGGFLGAQPAL